MIPTTPFIDASDKSNINKRTGKPLPQPEHEALNDLPVHPFTTQQTFLPVSESRAFSRVDAARAFNSRLKPADERIPHPEHVEIEKFKLTKPTNPELREFRNELQRREELDIASRVERAKERQARDVKVYNGHRWNFKIQDISVDTVGKDGRSRAGVGWRYGMPLEDRKRGQVKIPTSVA